MPCTQTVDIVTSPPAATTDQTARRERARVGFAMLKTMRCPTRKCRQQLISLLGCCTCFFFGKPGKITVHPPNDIAGGLNLPLPLGLVHLVRSWSFPSWNTGLRGHIVSPSSRPRGISIPAPVRIRQRSRVSSAARAVVTCPPGLDPLRNPLLTA